MAEGANGLTRPFAHAARELTAEEIQHLQKDTDLVSAFKQTKLEREAEKNWDLFYKRNTTKFFKDRHWTKREFEELIDDKKDSRRVILEVGCGVGNFMFPLLEEDEDKSLYFYACDFSKRAVQFVKDHPSYDSSRCTAFHADVTNSLTPTVPCDSVDIATMIFVLSAIHPDKMLQALRNIVQVLRPGGVLLFRDYGLYDYAMLRFAPGHKLSENLYVRQDGTRAYYFSLEVLQELAEKAGFTVIGNQYVQRETVNKKEGLCVARIFVQAKFAKPSSGTDAACVSQTHCGVTRKERSDCDEPVRVPCDEPVGAPCDEQVGVPCVSQLCLNPVSSSCVQGDRTTENAVTNHDRIACNSFDGSNETPADKNIS